MVLERPDGTAQAQTSPHQKQDVERADNPKVGEDWIGHGWVEERSKSKDWVSDEKTWGILRRGYLETAQPAEDASLRDNRLLLWAKRKQLCPCWSWGLALRAGLCWHVWRCHWGPARPSSLSPRQQLMTIHNHFHWYSVSLWCTLFFYLTTTFAWQWF